MRPTDPARGRTSRARGQREAVHSNPHRNEAALARRIAPLRTEMSDEGAAPTGWIHGAAPIAVRILVATGTTVAGTIYGKTAETDSATIGVTIFGMIRATMSGMIAETEMTTTAMTDEMIAETGSMTVETMIVVIHGGGPTRLYGGPPTPAHRPSLSSSIPPTTKIGQRTAAMKSIDRS